jgi:hypothetical protein
MTCNRPWTPLGRGRVPWNCAGFHLTQDCRGEGEDFPVPTAPQPRDYQPQVVQLMSWSVDGPLLLRLKHWHAQTHLRGCGLHVRVLVLLCYGLSGLFQFSSFSVDLGLAEIGYRIGIDPVKVPF